jgi:hypothetical protein
MTLLGDVAGLIGGLLLAEAYIVTHPRRFIRKAIKAIRSR